MTASQVLADWAVRLPHQPLPDEVRHAVCRHLLDGIGNAIGARRLGHARPALTVAETLGGPSEARALTGTTAISAPAAALATGALVHALDFDDTHGGALVHATAVVLPAALAVGQQVGAGGAAVVAATAAGLETACRLAAAVPHGFHNRGIHATAAVGPLAAAVTTILLTGQSSQTLVDALGIAASSSGGLLEFLDTGADTKSLHPGMASLNGVLAARLAGAGARGPGSILEGRRGLWAALTDVTPDVGMVTDQLGIRWEATRIGIKPYPSCQLMHVGLDALGTALGDAPSDVRPADVDRVKVFLHPDSAAVVGERRASGFPRSAYDAKFDVAWSIAALMTDGAVSVDTFTPSSIARADVAALAERISVTARHWPGQAADSGGEVHVHLHDGTTLVGSVESSRGTAAAPLTDDELMDKFIGNTGNHPLADQLAAEVVGLPDAPSIDRLLDLSAELVRPVTTED